MKWEELTGTPVEVTAVMAYKDRDGSLLVSMQIVPRNGRPQNILLSEPTVKRIASTLADMLALIN